MKQIFFLKIVRAIENNGKGAMKNNVHKTWLKK